MKSFTDIAQMNVDHYNDHPVAHTVMTVVTGIVGVVAARRYIRSIVKDDSNHYKSGWMAK